MSARALGRLVFCLSISVLIGARPGAGDEPARVDFNRDVRPILSDRCYACHGPDEGQRKAGLRLDVREGAFADLGGYRAVVSGKPGESELFRRITHPDPEERMPPPDAGKRLEAAEIETLRRWIEEGARWAEHWSRIPPVRPPVPDTEDDPWPRSAIDRFVLARLRAEGLEPAPEADARALIRRLHFDLTGLPAFPEDVDAFMRSDAPDRYERMVDDLLASVHFGERMAVHWLDLVRYADTNGIHGDNHRDVALYRDWVIDAFNRNLPFDRFTIDQLAGDLLPDGTVRDRVASGYNRLLMTTREGGAQPKEYRAKYAADRVRNASTVWLGATLGCAECHDHKFDPYTMKDFYSFAAFFADIEETAVGKQEPTPVPTPEEKARIAALEARIAETEAALGRSTPELAAAQAEWERSLAAAEELPEAVTEALAVPASERTDEQHEALAVHYRKISPLLEPERRRLEELRKEKERVEKSVATTLVTVSVKPRVTRILPRGNWLDDSGEVVGPAIPASLGRLEGGERRATRLDLARWLVSEENPVAARVVANRLWKLFFGRGIVRTPDDFGSQGARPTHPELLDWLAMELVESGWDIKRTVRLIVTSSAYRQSSRASSELLRRDPYNRLLARQGRFRLDAEMVRDNALAVSGLLVRRVGGRSVKPYQPAGYWAHLNFPKRQWKRDTGADLYRRGLYTYWCRTFLHPSLLAFDATTREECAVGRPRSNTPLQALVLLNDPTYVEAARVLAARILRALSSQSGAGAPDEPVRRGIRLLYRRVLAREPRAEEIRVLGDLYARHSAAYAEDPESAKALLGAGERPVPPGLSVRELAAWTSVARTVLNLHETITRY